MNRFTDRHNHRTAFFLLAVLTLLAFSCSEDEPSGCEGQDPVNFISLIAEQETIEAGGSTKITATAEGFGLEYEWTASQGFILPGEAANIVTYTASPCSIGEITITCKVTDACGNSDTKRKTIIVQ
jgi:hypothetical protein